MNELVSYQNEERISVITMDDGKVNSLSPNMIDAIDNALDKAIEDKSVVILTGRERLFSAGFDLNIFHQGKEASTNMMSKGANLALRIIEFPYPVIIASNGHALAMAALVLLSSDYRIGEEGNFKIGLNEVTLGMVMPHFGIEMARYNLSHQFFRRSLIQAEIYSPKTALEAGYLDETASKGQLLIRAKEKALELLKLDMNAFKETKNKSRKNIVNALNKAIEKDFSLAK
jgi:enoyl-CoA hydratase